MARLPKLFVTVSSTNLCPSYPVGYEIHASTHFWNGKLLEDTWAAVNVAYPDVHQTEAAYQYLRDTYLRLQETTSPSQSLFINLPATGVPSVKVSPELEEYWNTVALATSKGWRWSEGFHENLLTGERMKSHSPFILSLSTWEWQGRKVGSPITFTRLQKEGESKTDLLLRTLEFAEKAKHDFPDSIPRQVINGELAVDTFATRVVFRD